MPQNWGNGIEKKLRYLNKGDLGFSPYGAEEFFGNTQVRGDHILWNSLFEISVFMPEQIISFNGALCHGLKMAFLK